jgi:hypothetical protein
MTNTLTKVSAIMRARLKSNLSADRLLCSSLPASPRTSLSVTKRE